MSIPSRSPPSVSQFQRQQGENLNLQSSTSIIIQQQPYSHEIATSSERHSHSLPNSSSSITSSSSSSSASSTSSSSSPSISSPSVASPSAIAPFSYPRLSTATSYLGLPIGSVAAYQRRKTSALGWNLSAQLVEDEAMEGTLQQAINPADADPIMNSMPPSLPSSSSSSATSSSFSSSPSKFPSGSPLASRDFGHLSEATVIQLQLKRERRDAFFALAVLTLINLFNYIDRYVPSATKQQLEDDLHLTDSETSIPLTAFIVVYMLTSPIFSHLADLGFSRKKLICAGVIFWSIATAAAALSQDFWSLLCFRSLVGVGEAAYATIAPALLADFYPASKRNTILSYFYLAVPIGSALGYVVGGVIGGAFGWRFAFLACGVPGVILGMFTLLINEPVRGRFDEEDERERVKEEEERRQRKLSEEKRQKQGENVEQSGEDIEYGFNYVEASSHPRSSSDPASSLPFPSSHPSAPPLQRSVSDSVVSELEELADPLSPHPPASVLFPPSQQAVSWKESITLLIHNQPFLYSTSGLVFATFAAGGIADWFPTYLERYEDMGESSAGMVTGGITVAGGLLGTLLGAWMGEFSKKHTRNPYLFVAGFSMAIASAFSWLILIVPNKYVVCILLFFGQVFMWAYTGPLSALTVNAVPANLRTRAFALQILAQHALGDAISPTIVGVLSDAWHSLKAAVLILPVALSVCALIWLVGWRRMGEGKKEEEEGKGKGERKDGREWSERLLSDDDQAEVAREEHNTEESGNREGQRTSGSTTPTLVMNPVYDLPVPLSGRPSAVTSVADQLAPTSFI